MPQSKVPGLFVTGTDTGVGKTYIAALIAAALSKSGHRVGVYKPAASGCREIAGKLVSDDAVALWNAAGRPGSLEAVCPQRFVAPLAPHLAARAEGVDLSAERLRTGLDYWRERSDVVVVEGAGGLLSPLGEDEYVADLATDLGLPLIVVANNTIGTIHRTLATLVVAATYGEGLDVAGVVLNDVMPDSDDPSRQSNLQELQVRSVPPVLGLVAWQGDLPAGIDWMRLASSK